jgi:hypothetical protein
MAAAIVPVLVLFIAVVIIVVALLRSGRRAEERKDLAHEDAVDSLRYHVPPGQDPAAVIGALASEGYDAVRDSDANTSDILVLCAAGKERERAHVRAVIEHVAPLDMEGNPMPPHPVAFADEPRDGA